MITVQLVSRALSGLEDSSLIEKNKMEEAQNAVGNTFGIVEDSDKLEEEENPLTKRIDNISQ